MFFFFFSSRRRHTRFKCDWSSDVCSSDLKRLRSGHRASGNGGTRFPAPHPGVWRRSEEHTSELQSHLNLVCRLLLEKKKSTAMPLLNFQQLAHRWWCPPRWATLSRGRAASSLGRNFFFKGTATTQIYTLSLHDALPISPGVWR